jgi:hypothetical protein
MRELFVIPVIEVVQPRLLVPLLHTLLQSFEVI